MPSPPRIVGNGEPVLTDEMVLNLSKRLIDTSDLLTLAITGLGVFGHIVDWHINKNRPDIVIAAREVLTDWIKIQPDRHVAYTEMCKALRAAEMPHYICEVLEKSS